VVRPGQRVRGVRTKNGAPAVFVGGGFGHDRVSPRSRAADLRCGFRPCSRVCSRCSAGGRRSDFRPHFSRALALLGRRPPFQPPSSFLARARAARPTPAVPASVLISRARSRCSAGARRSSLRPRSRACLCYVPFRGVPASRRFGDACKSRRTGGVKSGLPGRSLRAGPPGARLDPARPVWLPPGRRTGGKPEHPPPDSRTPPQTPRTVPANPTTAFRASRECPRRCFPEEGPLRRSRRRPGPSRC